MDVCMNIYIHIHLYIYIHTHIYIRIHVWVGCQGGANSLTLSRDARHMSVHQSILLFYFSSPKKNLRSLLEHGHRQIEVILDPMMERSSSTFLESLDSFCDGSIYVNVLRRLELLLGLQSYICAHVLCARVHSLLYQLKLSEAIS
jgi:hypothetical protein